ncbi:toprim domain-containing protein [Staphylococcus hominis]|mgnify:FL=1|uniref:toprim domain-containing protein n=1 Tax=Staphylococcus hominis TaxID=1290 RepID=UPI000A7DDA7F|nr:toprim domain-containing protein [Staphylococcus hominis]MCI2919454.1 toprim domain-containing protein [Staphylococcus hominis]MDK7301598.1 toprim domain-containing protein [Staphylococcus hominis]MDS3885848.1 toprim domain-containing protein [Staphylococcus hominis]MDS3889957.1 toprim domain-containing protein [Staphylococcus hominis]MDS3927636.1 toprim domain-containing protein [Staphylococcus hominis]
MPKVHLCVDNDEAGNKFVQNFGEFENKETGETIEIKAEQPQMPDCKDWNDVLVEKHYNEKEKEHEQETKIIVNERNEYATKPQSNSSSNTKTAKKEKKSLVMEV